MRVSNRPKEKKEEKTIISSLNPSEMGFNNPEFLGMVTAVAARTRDIKYDERGAAKNVYSASAASTVQVAEEARDEALEKLKTKATREYRKDTDKMYVCGVKFDSAQSLEGIVEVCAYGTVIKP